MCDGSIIESTPVCNDLATARWRSARIVRLTDIDPLEAARAVGIDGPVTVTPLASNRGKGVWRVEATGARYALRVLRAKEDATARYELAAMSSARRRGVAVPEVVSVGSAGDHPVLLLEWCEGQVLAAEIRRRPWAAHRLGRVCGAAQAGLASSPLERDEVELVDWMDRFGPTEPELAARLRSVEGRAGLLHLDLHPLNVLVRDGSVAAVIDWTNAAAGDGRADLARTWSLLLATRRRSGIRRRLLYLVLAHGWHRGHRSVAGRAGDARLFRLWALEAWLRTDRTHGRERASLQRTADRLRRRLGLPGPTGS